MVEKPLMSRVSKSRNVALATRCLAVVYLKIFPSVRELWIDVGPFQ